MTASPTPNTPSFHPAQDPAAQQHDAAAVTALVPSQHSKTDEGTKADAPVNFDGPVARLPVELDVAVPIRDFRICHLLALRPGAVVSSQWAHADDLPVLAGNQPLAWSEFEVVDTRLAVRITRLP